MEAHPSIFNIKIVDIYFMKIQHFQLADPVFSKGEFTLDKDTDDFTLQMFAAANYQEWLRWTKLTEVKFYYIYTNNKVNEALGRALTKTRIRRGTRASIIFDQLPNGSLAGGAKPPKVRPYYDIDQQGWRSFALDPNRFVVLTAVRSVKTGKWVRDPKEFTDKILGNLKEAREFWT
jgi:hypothetical protein